MTKRDAAINGFAWERFDAWVVKRMKEGESLAEIAASLGTSVSRVHQLRKGGEPPPKLRVAARIQERANIPARLWVSYLP